MASDNLLLQSYLLIERWKHTAEAMRLRIPHYDHDEEHIYDTTDDVLDQLSRVLDKDELDQHYADADRREELNFHD